MLKALKKLFVWDHETQGLSSKPVRPVLVAVDHKLPAGKIRVGMRVKIFSNSYSQRGSIRSSLKVSGEVVEIMPPAKRSKSNQKRYLLRVENEAGIHNVWVASDELVILA